MNARTTRAQLAAMAAGALAAMAITYAPPAAASPETDFLGVLTSGGFVIYDAPQALDTGWDICSAVDAGYSGEQVAQHLFATTTWDDLSSMDAARYWVVAAATTLCPWNWNPQSARTTLA